MLNVAALPLDEPPVAVAELEDPERLAEAPVAVAPAPLPVVDAAPEVVGLARSVKRADDANCTQFDDAGILGVYGKEVIGPSDSGGWE